VNVQNISVVSCQDGKIGYVYFVGEENTYKGIYGSEID